MEPQTEADEESDAEPEPSESPSEPPARGDRWDRWDSLLVVAAAAVTFWAHPLHLIFSRPYWLDEAWVAVLTRTPFSSFRHFTASAPIGFIILSKLVPGSGLQRARLVPLVFSAASAGMAYALVRWCRWNSKSVSRLAATAAALVVILAPLALTRNDLKQYTCDGFAALLIFGVAVRVDRSGGRTPVWWLAVASLLSLPFSSTSAFVSVAAYAGLLGSALSTRSRRRIVEILVTGAATGVALAVFFGAVVLANTNDKLRHYWDQYYLAGSPFHVLHESWKRLSALHSALGMPVIVFVALFAVGIVTLVMLHERALAIAAPVLWLEMVLAARLRKYPFLDLRTSHFLLISSLAVCAIGAAGLVYAACRWNRVVAGAIAIVFVVQFTNGFASHLHTLNIPHEDARAQAEYVAAHDAPNDVILVSQAGAYAFAYYWPHGSIVTPPDDTVSQGFFVRLNGVDAVFARGRTDDAVLGALRTADERLRARGPGSRLYVVRSHLNSGEVVAWRSAFAKLGLHARSIHTGVEPLLVVESP